MPSLYFRYYTQQGRIQDFKLGGSQLKKLRRAEGGAKIFGVFRVKNHDFTQKNYIFSNFRGGGVRPPLDPPLHRLVYVTRLIINKINKVQWVDFKLENVIVSLHSLKTMGRASAPSGPRLHYFLQ